MRLIQKIVSHKDSTYDFLITLSGLILEVENEIDPNKSFQDESF